MRKRGRSLKAGEDFHFCGCEGKEKEIGFVDGCYYKTMLGTSLVVLFASVYGMRKQYKKIGDELQVVYRELHSNKNMIA